MTSNDKLLTALATVLVALPGTASLVPHLDLTPLGQFLLLVLAMAGGAILKFQPGPSLSDEDVKRIAAERERLQRVARVRAAGEQSHG